MAPLFPWTSERCRQQTCDAELSAALAERDGVLVCAQGNETLRLGDERALLNLPETTGTALRPLYCSFDCRS